MAIPGAPSDSGTPLADLFSGVNRPQLNAFVANSQARNGLVSAQTQDAMIRASQAQEQMASWDRIKGDFIAKGASDSDASLARDAIVGATNHDSVNAENLLKAGNSAVLSNPALMGTVQQTAAQQGYEGKIAGPIAAPNNFFMAPGSAFAGQQPQQTAQGAAQLAQTKAVTGMDVERAELEHQQAKNAATLGAGGLTPQSLQEAARVTMARPELMSSYAGYGNTGQANKNAINNARAQMLNDAGMTPDDMIRQRAIAKASVGGANQAAKQIQALDAYMPLIKNNGQRIMQLLDQIDANGVVDEPIVNGFARSLGRNLNSDDLAELHSVFGAYQPELGRLLTAGPTLNGVVSNEARAGVASMAPENMSSSQARRVINRVNTELDIRRNGAQGSLEEAANRQVPVVNAQPGNGPPAAAGAPDDPSLPPGFHRMN